MGKYLVHWEMDQTKIPIDPKERGEAWGMLMAMVRQDVEKGIVKDFGMFVGETSGYAVHEGTEVEVMKTLQQYVPFAIFLPFLFLKSQSPNLIYSLFSSLYSIRIKDSSYTLFPSLS